MRIQIFGEVMMLSCGHKGIRSEEAGLSNHFGDKSTWSAMMRTIRGNAAAARSILFPTPAQSLTSKGGGHMGFRDSCGLDDSFASPRHPGRYKVTLNYSNTMTTWRGSNTSVTADSKDG